MNNTKLKVILTFFLLSSVTVNSYRDNTINERPKYIAGGSNAPDGAFPYQASLVTRYHFCGASIISCRWVLTAAHCLLNIRPYYTRVRVGSNKKNDLRADIYDVDYFYIHNGYTIHNFTNDIGVARVSTDIKFSSRVKPIKLPLRDMSGKYSAVVTGWGRLSFIGETPNDLQVLRVETITNELCSEAFKGTNVLIWDKHICTRQKDGTGVCTGDSGSPLVMNGIQIGIVSMDVNCGKGYPDVYTRVFSFMDWIYARTAITYIAPNRTRDQNL